MLTTCGCQDKDLNLGRPGSETSPLLLGHCSSLDNSIHISSARIRKKSRAGDEFGGTL